MNLNWTGNHHFLKKIHTALQPGDSGESAIRSWHKQQQVPAPCPFIQFIALEVQA